MSPDFVRECFTESNGILTWKVRPRKWKAGIKAKGKHYHLGYFDSLNEAAAAYEAASKIHHKEFSFTG